jgi:hypothetical protein
MFELQYERSVGERLFVFEETAEPYSEWEEFVADVSAALAARMDTIVARASRAQEEQEQ